ncbi:MAG: response regulator transcription factor, partial [Bacteroidia bacterium]|nr:response regulator transcription factor [Bacteroidia bacterium]
MKKTENSRIKLILAEDQELVRKALISLLKENPNIEVIGEAENGKKLLELLKQVEPDIVLLDIEMPVMNGQEALDVISKRFPAIKVIILSMYEEMALMSDFITKGARAYLPKGCSIERLFEAIETVNAKGHF